MAAPGVADYLLAPETGDYRQSESTLPTGYDAGSGSSLSAPLVSGALALMRQYFAEATNCGSDQCGLGAHELAARILATADKRGVYADSKTYGAGLLDLKNALTPQGELRLLSGLAVKNSQSHPLSQSALKTGAALGDAIQTALRDTRIAAFDEMNAPFPVDANALIKSESESTNGLRAALTAMQLSETQAPKTQWNFKNGLGWLAFRDATFPEPLRGGTIFGANGYANPYSALARGGMSAGLQWNSFQIKIFGEGHGQNFQTRGALGSFSLSSFPGGKEGGEEGGEEGDEEGVGWRFHFGGVDEPNGFLSSSGAGAFSNLRARTMFAGADYVGGDWNGWQIHLGGFIGSTSSKNSGGQEWFSETESMRSDSFHIGMERKNIFHSADGLGFRLRQPLRASDSLKIRLPTGRTRHGELTWREVSATPSGRELSLEVLYRRPLNGGTLRISSAAVSEPGHQAKAKTTARLLLSFEQKF